MSEPNKTPACSDKVTLAVYKHMRDELVVPQDKFNEGYSVLHYSKSQASSPEGIGGPVQCEEIWEVALKKLGNYSGTCHSCGSRNPCISISYGFPLARE